MTSFSYDDQFADDDAFEVAPLAVAPTFWVKTRVWEQFCFSASELGEMIAVAIAEGLPYEVEACPF